MPLSSTEMVADPAAFYATLREHGGPVVPVHLDGEVPAWLVIGYDACNTVLRDGLLFTRDLGQWHVTKQGLLPQDWPIGPHVQPMRNMLFASGHEHQRLRGAFKTSLHKVGQRRLHATITRVADRLIEGFVEDGQADIVGQYAVPLPVAVLTQLFGFPPEDAERLQRTILTLLGGGEGALDANVGLNAMIEDHVRRRRQEPRADIVTWLLEADLSDEETRETVWLAINAGVGSTTAWAANTCEVLARAEDARTDLRSMLRDIPGVMAEVLWNHAPVQQVIGRVATADMDLHGTRVRRGDLLIISPAGANLDHDRFGGRALRADYVESNASHLAWGSGAHECPAPGLATAIVRGGVERLWTRLDDIHLAFPGQPTQWSPSIIVRLPARLDIAFDPVRARKRAATLAPIGDR
ncbi:cytochrome P450 [Streptomyces glaucescens]|uniref:cytochrome P450 n=1 Tax=Streptomyces glaucescens TaxID=1907 RepID=UPI001180C94B|nr:cytochrome P450 [Streptomyces glaucescens]